ncbi:BZ3501_MvSof-1269-A2-R1_Chr12-1g03371 [Microbotryum saponariae]|nr:BZ3501_MvSof-1269-A2-R1_Chr12-1g03371 [Microbotryum saponariae]
MTSTIVDDKGVSRITKVDANAYKTQPRDIKTFLLLSGPNLNLFGTRDPKQYGTMTLADIEERVTKFGDELGVKIVHYARCLGGVVMNPGAFAHYSYALHDAIEACTSPVIEVHISNVYAREEFRHKSVAARVSSGYIAGCGVLGYDVRIGSQGFFDGYERRHELMLGRVTHFDGTDWSASRFAKSGGGIGLKRFGIQVMQIIAMISYSHQWKQHIRDFGV